MSDRNTVKLALYDAIDWQNSGYSDLSVERRSAMICERCQGNGEIVTDWERYRHPLDGDVGDEAVAECPDCSGTGYDCSDGHVWHDRTFASMNLRCCVNCGFIKNEDKPCPGPIGVTLDELRARYKDTTS